jgi:hypothetical protein
MKLFTWGTEKMKQLKTLYRNMDRPQVGRLLHAFPTILLIMSLGLGSVVSGGCLAVPAVMFTTAAVTAVAVVSEGERLVQYPDAGSSAIVQNETDPESACKQMCQRHEPPPEEDLPGV